MILATAREFIGGRDLCALNEAMSEPVPETTTRTRQTLYPQLHLFYHLALAGELFHKVPGKGGKLILEATDRLAQYEELKLTERYFFLLETFWVDCDWKKLQSGHGVRLDPPYEVPPVMELLGEPAAARKKKEVEGYIRSEPLFPRILGAAPCGIRVLAGRTRSRDQGTVEARYPV